MTIVVDVGMLKDVVVVEIGSGRVIPDGRLKEVSYCPDASLTRRKTPIRETAEAETIL